MWTSLLNFLGLYETKHCRVARTLLCQREPDIEVLGTKVLKREADLWIVAVFFQKPNIRVKPPRYRVFSVCNDMSKIDELPCDPSSPYWIRGRK